MMKRTLFAASATASAALLLGALVALLLGFAYNPAFYMWCMDGAGVFDGGAVDESSAGGAVSRLTNYISGGAEALAVEPIRVSGGDRAFPNEREAAHMADVARLFRLAEKVGLGSFIVFAAAAAIIIANRKKGEPMIGLGAAVGGLVWVAATGALAAFASADFYALFYRFHELIFANDLWLMDPRSDVIIRLMPTAFFARFAGVVAACWLAVVAIIIAIGFTVWKKSRARSY